MRINQAQLQTQSGAAETLAKNVCVCLIWSGVYARTWAVAGGFVFRSRVKYTRSVKLDRNELYLCKSRKVFLAWSWRVVDPIEDRN